MIDGFFGSEFRDFLELAFQAKGFGDNLGRLARSHEGTGEYGIEGYSQTAQAPRRSPHSLDSFWSQRSLAVGLHPGLIRGDGDTVAHQIELHWHTTVLARLYRLLRQMTPVIKEQGGDSFVDFVSAAAIRRENNGAFARCAHRVWNRPLFHFGFAGQGTALFVRIAKGNYQIDFVGRDLIHAFGRAR